MSSADVRLVLILVLVAVLIVAHHWHKHRADAHLTWAEKYFQASDIANHETWVVACLAAAAAVAATGCNQD